jgi:hypothetical protein
MDAPLAVVRDMTSLWPSAPPEAGRIGREWKGSCACSTFTERASRFVRARHGRFHRLCGFWCAQLIDFGVSRKILGAGMREILTPAMRHGLQVRCKAPSSRVSPILERRVYMFGTCVFLFFACVWFSVQAGSWCVHGFSLFLRGCVLCVCVLLGLRFLFFFHPAVLRLALCWCAARLVAFFQHTLVCACVWFCCAPLFAALGQFRAHRARAASGGQSSVEHVAGCRAAL